jgi:hypothetical protein
MKGPILTAELDPINLNILTKVKSGTKSFE